MLACACFALALSTVLVPMSHTGGDRWVWSAGLLGATVCAGAVLAVFRRSPSGSMDAKKRGVRQLTAGE